MYEQRYLLYLKAHIRELEKYIRDMEDETNDKQILFKVVFYGIKSAIMQPKAASYDEAVSEFEVISALKHLMGQLTLNEFMNLFPVEKDFTGHKYGVKDYYSTMEYVNTFDPNKPIGGNVLMLLSKYMNKDIHELLVRSALVISDLRKYEGHLSLIEEFIAAEGHDTPNTFKNAKGEVMYVRNGKPTLVEKMKTNKLELVK